MKRERSRTQTAAGPYCKLVCSDTNRCCALQLSSLRDIHVLDPTRVAIFDTVVEFIYKGRGVWFCSSTLKCAVKIESCFDQPDFLGVIVSGKSMP